MWSRTVAAPWPVSPKIWAPFGHAARPPFRRQGQLDTLLSEAREWGNAPQAAAEELESDWSLITRVAGGSCQCPGGRCLWQEASRSFFERNTMVQEGPLAHCLARVITEGPSKTTRVPLIAGPSNTAKSTMLDPIDVVFGPQNVLHKPAMGATMPLANLTKPNKRFLYLDEFSCVEYASQPVGRPTFPYSTQLKLFSGQFMEVQVSQRFHDGNPDAKWTRGVAVTSKLKGLWTPRGGVSAEDITHLQNRFEQFTANGRPLTKQELRTVPPCRVNWCKWLVATATAFANGAPAAPPQLPPQPRPAGGGAAAAGVEGLLALTRRVSIPDDVANALHDDALAAGAASVSELTADDWAALPSWGRFLPLQQRRVLSASAAPTLPQ